MATPIHVAPRTKALEAGVPVPLLATKLASGQNIVPAGFHMDISADAGVI